MANEVFERSLATISQAMGAVQDEVKRLESYDTFAAGIQQRIDALKVQESELKAVVNDLAGKIPASKQAIADAQEKAVILMRDAHEQRSKHVAAGKQEAAGVIDAARHSAAKLLEDAKAEAVPHKAAAEDAKRELAQINQHIDVAKGILAQMKQTALMFANQLK